MVQGEKEGEKERERKREKNSLSKLIYEKVNTWCVHDQGYTDDCTSLIPNVHLQYFFKLLCPF